MKQTENKVIYLPLKSQPICGHNLGPMGLGDLMTGREESIMIVHGKKADYHRSHEYSSCSKCNKEAQKAMEREVEKLEARPDCPQKPQEAHSGQISIERLNT